MAGSLTSQDYVEAALLRELTDAELDFVARPDSGLIDQVSELLRQRVPAIDALIAAYNPVTGAGIAPSVVSVMLGRVVKRYLENPRGAVSRSEAMGPFSQSEAFALRSDKERPGALEISDEDVAVLFPNRRRVRAGTHRTRAALAPRPVGRYGPLPGVAEAIAAEETYSGGIPLVIPDAAR